MAGVPYSFHRGVLADKLELGCDNLQAATPAVSVLHLILSEPENTEVAPIATTSEAAATMAAPTNVALAIAVTPVVAAAPPAAPAATPPDAIPPDSVKDPVKPPFTCIFTLFSHDNI